MGRRPGKGFSIERKNRAIGYRPSNCYWATAKQQARNRSDTVFVRMDGITKSLAEWCEGLGIKRDSVLKRIYKGENAESALQRPVRAWVKKQ